MGKSEKSEKGKKKRKKQLVSSAHGNGKYHPLLQVVV
jgi:hypothetical protein